MSAVDNTIDSNEVEDFVWDWSTRLAAGETIASKTVTVVDANGTTATNATVASSSATTTTVSARISGASGTIVYLLCRVITSTARTLDDTWLLIVTQH